MTASDYIALGALAISLASFVFSFIQARRSGRRLKVFCHAFCSENGPLRARGVKLVVRNVGGMAIRLSWLEREFATKGRVKQTIEAYDVDWSKYSVADVIEGRVKSPVVTLAPGESYEKSFYRDEPLDLFDSEHGDPATDLWIEDAVGNSYHVTHARRELKRLWAT
jgi:hypothetical protein